MISPNKTLWSLLNWRSQELWKWDWGVTEHRGFVQTLNKESYTFPSSPHPEQPVVFPLRTLRKHTMSFLDKLENQLWIQGQQLLLRTQVRHLPEKGDVVNFWRGILISSSTSPPPFLQPWQPHLFLLREKMKEFLICPWKKWIDVSGPQWKSQVPTWSHYLEGPLLTSPSPHTHTQTHTLPLAWNTFLPFPVLLSPPRLEVDLRISN